ncbi:hypothetical protein EYB53_018165 [Candidatus Chloroploca sp. M-50]|uniref:Uncharacterized protein n=1 Tax=Candidatus Chloroploca mongolica TaxID=2528176 RepID=A0ABS4DDW8_9CHLR|nr:hypothetical protein [Candidatus Chloroploca mongolica]MBP1467645.1 hypothetical protein [Candidatus Chloroploca mongolica]
MQRFLLATILFVTFSFASLATPASAQTAQRCFAETGFCISGPIRAYWERNGGLAVFGFPITEQRVERVEDRTITVQWFERDRLEIQADGTLTTGRLGARVLEMQWRPWQMGNEMPRTGTCRFFAETGYHACDAFLRYWERNGGLERFGYPLTPVFEEELEGRVYQVQYFERRRMELHPDLPPGSSSVLLGLLGNAVLKELIPSSPWASPQCLENMSAAMRLAHQRLPAPEVLGCPQLYAPSGMPGSIQHFERGEMIWFQPPSIIIPGGVLPRTIMVYLYGEPHPRFLGPFFDDWEAGRDPERPAPTPPPGFYAPVRGFAKVWSTHPEVAQALGWAIEPEPQMRKAEYQIMGRGLMVRLYEGEAIGTVYAFGDPAIPTQVRKVTP